MRLRMIILLYIIIFYNIRRNCLQGIKQKQVLGMNGLLYKDGVPTIWTVANAHNESLRFVCDIDI